MLIAEAQRVNVNVGEVPMDTAEKSDSWSCYGAGSRFAHAFFYCTYCSTVSVFALYTVITTAAEAMAAVTIDHVIVLASALPMLSFTYFSTVSVLNILLLKQQLKLWQLLQLIM